MFTFQETTAADNNMDNEDSLNLTIGEDEEKLLHGDVMHSINLVASLHHVTE